MIVPTGFILSLLLFAKINNYSWDKKDYKYMLCSGLAVFAITIGIYFFLENTDFAPHGHSTSGLETPTNHD